MIEGEGTVSAACVIGIDVGTSGVRAAALDRDGQWLADASLRYASSVAHVRDPLLWWQCCVAVLTDLGSRIERRLIESIVVDATSGTLLAIDDTGRPLSSALMYNDAVDDATVLAAIERHMPDTSAAGGTTSGLAKALVLQGLEPDRIVHQADWIAGRLLGDFGHSDTNNALKTGYDPIALAWPDWIGRTGLQLSRLPEVHHPGEALGPIDQTIARQFDLPATCQVLAGTTDGCAAFLATGASKAGDAVTSLGSTITMKLLSDTALFDPACGLYSHRLGDRWLAGGASNSGGRVLAKYFDADAITSLSRRIDAGTSSGLDYYPLLEPGERFPISDPTLQPRLEPRPDDDVQFLHGLLEGMTRIEAQGYRRLVELGAPPLRSVRTVGGGARNEAWTRLREQALGVESLPSASQEAAVGAARLAFSG